MTDPIDAVIRALGVPKRILQTSGRYSSASAALIQHQYNRYRGPSVRYLFCGKCERLYNIALPHTEEQCKEFQ